MPSPRRLARACRAAAAVAAALILTGALGACSQQPVANPDVADAGYEAGDGTFVAWSRDQRADAVELVGTTFDGEEIDLTDWRGEVVVLNFWYADCPPCRVEAADLAAIATDYADTDVRVLGVNGRDDADRVAAFHTAFDVPYPSLDDSGATAVAALQGLVPLSAYPTTVVLDREGRPAARIIGRATGETLRDLIDDVLAEA